MCEPQIQSLIDADAANSSDLQTTGVASQISGWYNDENKPTWLNYLHDNFIIVQFHLERPGGLASLTWITVHIQIATNPALKPAFVPQPYTGSPSSMELAKGWLNKCRASHETCRPLLTESAWRPARLIRLPDNPAESPVLREASEEEYAYGVQYMTLSHRWAPGKQLQLQRSNLHHLRESIDLDELKAAIRDAITTAKHLGVEYLWIDTLCILQDDDADRDREITLMDRVYSNSVCNIAASDARTNEEGCFFKRDEFAVKAYLVKLDTDPYPFLRHLIRLEWQFVTDYVEDCVLEHRGWVFQERVLSPRVLHCCKQQLHWECRKLQASETYPDGEPGYVASGRGQFQRPSLKKELYDMPYKESTWDEIANVSEVWRQIVSAYTSRSLTFSEDKLRAMAGIKSVWERLHKDEYVAGIWRSTLLGDLLWVPKPSANIPFRRIPSDKAPAPTWSWASFSGPVFFLIDSFWDVGELKCRLNGISIRPPTTRDQSSNIGLVHLAQDETVLHLYGCPVPARWAEHEDDLANKGIVRLIMRAGADKHLFDEPYDCWDEYVSFDDPSLLLPEDIICLPILEEPYALNGAVRGLVLTAPDAIENDCWRLGSFRSSDYASFNVPEMELALH